MCVICYCKMLAFSEINFVQFLGRRRGNVTLHPLITLAKKNGILSYIFHQGG